MMKVRKPNVPKSLYAKFATQAKNNHLNFWKKYWIFCSCFENESNHKAQCDYDSKLVLTK